jgi:hypothetical protein
MVRGIIPNLMILSSAIRLLLFGFEGFTEDINPGEGAFQLFPISAFYSLVWCWRIPQQICPPSQLTPPSNHFYDPIFMTNPLPCRDHPASLKISMENN